MKVFPVVGHGAEVALGVSVWCQRKDHKLLLVPACWGGSLRKTWDQETRSLKKILMRNVTGSVKNSENEAQEKGKVQKTVQKQGKNSEHGNRQNLTWSFTYITITPQHSLWLYEESFLVWFFFKWSEHTHKHTHTRGSAGVTEAYSSPEDEMWLWWKGGLVGYWTERARTHTAGDLGVVQPLHNSLAGQSNLSLSINILLKQHTKRERPGGRASGQVSVAAAVTCNWSLQCIPDFSFLSLAAMCH